MKRSMTQSLFLPLLALAVLLAGAPGAVADPFGYSVTSDQDDLLYRIDLATGATTAIGPVGFTDVEALSFQPGTNVLFGYDTATDQLITIDLLTGAGALVGPSGFVLDDPGLAFDDLGNLFLADELSEFFFFVDHTTGDALPLGPVGQITALAFRDGLFYGIDDQSDELIAIDLLNGPSVIGPLGIDVEDGGLDFDASGILYGINDEDVNGTSTIFTVNLVTGAATTIATTLDFESLAIPFAEIPEPGSLVLLLTGAGGLGLLLQRRRKPA